MGLIAGISILNEKWLKIPNDIALLLFSFIICAALQGASHLFSAPELHGMLAGLEGFQFESYLLDGVLCFMLFAGAGKVRFGKFTSNLKAITLLSFLTTAVSAILYGILFFALSCLLEWPLDIWLCILLGCIVSPTDPIAATGIMNKLGMSKNVTTVIESESLFNDGMGVVLFAFVKGLVAHAGRENFVLLMLREVAGAAAVALSVSFLLFELFKRSRKPMNHIFISLFAVSSIYVICEGWGFSGVIASVICGMYFSYATEKISRYRQVVDPGDTYAQFWDSIDGILNSVLFVLIGISVVRLPLLQNLWIIAAAAVVIGLGSGAAGVALPALLSPDRVIPGGYSLWEFVALMTWSALKGGLSLALVLSTRAFLKPELYNILLDAAYVTIFFTVVVQGLTTKRVYRLIERHKARRIQKEGLTR